MTITARIITVRIMNKVVLLKAATRLVFLGIQRSQRVEFTPPSLPDIVTPAREEPVKESKPLAQSSATDYSGKSQLSAKGKACVPCGNDHLSRAAGALSESIRFAREGGVSHPEVVSRITFALDELNTFEGIDGAPEKVADLPPGEKSMMNDMMVASRAIRHHITDIDSVEKLEQTAKIARQKRVEFITRLLKKGESNG